MATTHQGVATEPTHEARVSRPWLLVALLSATATASYLCRVNVSVAGALMMSDFGFSQEQMGRIFSAFLLGYAFCQVPAGMLADRFGARRVLSVSALSWVAATVLLACVGWWPAGLGPAATIGLLLAARFVLGVGESPTYPAAAQGVAQWIPAAKRARANGLVIASIGLGSAIAPPLLSFVMMRWGWRAALLVSAVPALAVAIVWLRVGAGVRAASTATAHSASIGCAIEDAHAPATLDRSVVGDAPGNRFFSSAAADPAERDRGSVANAPRGNWSRLASPSFVLLTASYTLQGYVGYIFVFWFYLYLVQVRHFDLLRGAALSSLPWVLSIVAIPLGGLVSDRLAAGRLGEVWGRRAVPMFGLGCAGVFLALGAHAPNAYVAAAYLALSTALVLCVEGPFWATMASIAGGKTGTAGGVMNMGSNIGGLISPALTPFLAARIGWENALYIAAALSVVAALMWLGVCAESQAAEVPVTPRSLTLLPSDKRT